MYNVLLNSAPVRTKCSYDMYVRQVLVRTIYFRSVFLLKIQSGTITQNYRNETHLYHQQNCKPTTSRPLWTRCFFGGFSILYFISFIKLEYGLCLSGCFPTIGKFKNVVHWKTAQDTKFAFQLERSSPNTTFLMKTNVLSMFFFQQEHSICPIKTTMKKAKTIIIVSSNSYLSTWRCTVKMPFSKL